MKVQLTPAALRDLALLRKVGAKGAGFLLGSAMGRFIIVERLLALDFDRTSGDGVYRSVSETYGQGLQGVFFYRRRPFALDCFLQDLVAVIDDRQIEIRRCEFSAAKRKSVLLPVPEDKEEKWES